MERLSTSSRSCSPRHFVWRWVCGVSCKSLKMLKVESDNWKNMKRLPTSETRRREWNLTRRVRRIGWTSKVISLAKQEKKDWRWFTLIGSNFGALRPGAMKKNWESPVRLRMYENVSSSRMVGHNPRGDRSNRAQAALHRISGTHGIDGWAAAELKTIASGATTSGFFGDAIMLWEEEGVLPTCISHCKLARVPEKDQRYLEPKQYRPIYEIGIGLWMGLYNSFKENLLCGVVSLCFALHEISHFAYHSHLEVVTVRKQIRLLAKLNRGPWRVWWAPNWREMVSRSLWARVRSGGSSWQCLVAKDQPCH